MKSLLQDVLCTCKMDKISVTLDTISERLYTVENKKSYIEKQLYLWKLHEQTSNKPQYAPRRQQIPQYVAPISRKTHQPPIMNPYFKPPRYKKHVNEPQAPTEHTQHTTTTHQPPSTRPSPELDAPTQPPVQPVQLTTLTTPAQPTTLQEQLAQPDQTTEAYQTTLPTSTKTETQRTPMPKRYSHSALTSQQIIMDQWNEIVTKIIMDQHVSISKFKTMLKSYLLVSSFTLTYTK